MKTLKVLTMLMVLVLVAGYVSSAYARTASVVTHASITVLPRSQNTASAQNTEGSAVPEIKDADMTTTLDRIETSDGGKIMTTTVGVL